VWSPAAGARSDAAPDVAARRRGAKTTAALVALALRRYSARLLNASASRGKEVLVTQKDILG
jgi:hypothetical protein